MLNQLLLETFLGQFWDKTVLSNRSSFIFTIFAKANTKGAQYLCCLV